MKKQIRLTESQLHNIIKESVNSVLNEISNKTLARAIVGANVDWENLKNSNDDLAKNRNGKTVHRETQKNRRDRQSGAFADELSARLSKELNANVNVGDYKFGGVTYHGDSYKKTGPDKYDRFYFRSHEAHPNGNEPSNNFSNYDKKNHRSFNISPHEIEASGYAADLADAMAGYHDELAKQSQKHINNMQDAIDDTNNYKKYDDELNAYYKRRDANKKAIDDFNNKPWYKKIGKKAPEAFNEPEPTSPQYKTGRIDHDVYDLSDKIRTARETAKRNRDAYNKHLK